MKITKEISNFQHKNLANQAWFSMSLVSQLGNIGSEVNRALNWKNKNNQEQMKKALFRALELIYLTVEDKKKLNKIKRNFNDARIFMRLFLRF